MEFRDLGPLTVTFDGAPVRLAGSRLLSALAALLVHDESVSEDRLIDAVWGEQPPARAGAALDTLIFRLRQVLEPGRTRRDGWQVLRTEGAGYRLVAHEVDSRRFAQESSAARVALADGGTDRALALAERALGRWRGPAYDDLPDWLDPVRARLDDLRVGTQELRIDALLALGRPEQAVSSVGPLVQQHPFRERLWAQWTLGLYRAGRQAAALETLERARRVLDEELGVSPGPELSALLAAVLDHSPALQGPTATPVVVSNLPAAGRELHGRAGDLAAVGALLQPGAVVTVTGPVGVGKTSLALAVARTTRHRDGVQFVDLTRGGEVIDSVASTLELRAEGTDVMGAVARHLQGRDLLLVLDNCEHVLDAVADLVDRLPPTITVLATSREPLEVDREQEHRLSTLDREAIDVFVDAAGLDPELADLEQISAICTGVGGLPLGIHLAARRARTFTLDEVLAGVRQNPGALTPGRRESRAGRSLADEIDLSLRSCEPFEQVAHQRLSVLTGPFTLAAAEAVLDDDRTMDILAGLARRSLLVVEPREGRRATRFRQLVPIRHHAAAEFGHSATAGLDGADAPGRGGEDVVGRRNRFVVDLTGSVPQRGRPGQRVVYDQVENDLPTVAATVDELLTTDGQTAARVALDLVGWAHDRNRLSLVRRWLTRAIDLPDLDPHTRALTGAALGSILEIARDLPAAHALFDRSLPILTMSDDPLAVGVLTDVTTAAWIGDDWAFGAQTAQVALDRASALGLHHERRIAESALTAAMLFSGPPQDALAAAETLLADTVDNGRAELLLCATAGVAALFSGRPEAGLRWTARSLQIAQDLGVRNMGETLEQRGNHLAAAGRHLDAVRCFGAAAAQYERVGLSWPRHDGTTTTVEQLRTAVPVALFDDAWAAGGRLVEAGDGVHLADWV